MARTSVGWDEERIPTSNLKTSHNSEIQESNTKAQLNQSRIFCKSLLKSRKRSSLRKKRASH